MEDVGRGRGSRCPAGRGQIGAGRCNASRRPPGSDPIPPSVQAREQALAVVAVDDQVGDAGETPWGLRRSEYVDRRRRTRAVCGRPPALAGGPASFGSEPDRSIETTSRRLPAWRTTCAVGLDIPA